MAPPLAELHEELVSGEAQGLLRPAKGPRAEVPTADLALQGTAGCLRVDGALEAEAVAAGATHRRGHREGVAARQDPDPATARLPEVNQENR